MIQRWEYGSVLLSRLHGETEHQLIEEFYVERKQ